MKTWPMLAAAALLSTGTAPGAPAGPPAPRVAVALGMGELRMIALANGHTSPLPFGTALAQVRRAVSAAAGHPGRTVRLEECGAGPLTQVSWPNGLAILAQDGRFVGWEVKTRGLTTMDGIGVGSPRARLVAQYHPRFEKSTLGSEFQIGSSRSDAWSGGLMSSPKPAARVTAFWSGVTCHFG